MKAYDKKAEERSYFILNTSRRTQKNKWVRNIKAHITIVMHLYYVDMLERWTKYIDDIPSYIECLVISSNEELIRIIESDVHYSYIKIVKKPNVGRDISALLVTAKEYIKESDYVCFVHDKKEHQDPYRYEETDLWVHNLWENTIGSSVYIENVLETFENDPQLGILSVPEPIGLYFDTWAGRGWYGSFQATKDLAEKLHLKCDISPDEPPVTIGTALWFRTMALSKLFSYPWDYTDFDDSKLKSGNYVSYAVERIFSYVAQDAGFKTGTVMSKEYAEKQTAYAQSLMKIYTDTLFKLIGVTQGGDCLNIIHNYEKMIKFTEGASKCYIYGAGRWGKTCLKLLRLAGQDVTAFVVSKKEKDDPNDEIPVIEFDSLTDINESTVFIVSVKDIGIRKEIIKNLKTNNVEYFCFWE